VAAAVADDVVPADEADDVVAAAAVAVADDEGIAIASV
jgi:formaldehyde-activating enzyme involved in methanogenesis